MRNRQIAFRDTAVLETRIGLFSAIETDNLNRSMEADFLGLACEQADSGSISFAAGRVNSFSARIR
jgi:hypothetical protein